MNSTGLNEDNVFISESGMAYYVGKDKEDMEEIMFVVASLAEGDVSFEKCLNVIKGWKEGK